jgi:branched chain amino acid efflux pump
MRFAWSLHGFAHGFRALLPLWLGAAPVAVVYAVTARAAGLTTTETQVMSLLVFSAPTQLGVANLLSTGASLGALLLMTVVLNLHQLLLGVSLGRLVPLSRAERMIAAYFLTDGAYGTTVASGTPSFAFLLGAELSMFVVWNVGTWLGAHVGHLLPDPRQLGVDFVFPLTFLSLLIPLVRSRAAFLTALCAGGVAFAAARLWPGSIAVVVGALFGSLAGACWIRTRLSRSEATPIDAHRS